MVAANNCTSFILFVAGQRIAEMPPIGEVSDVFTSLNMCVAGCGWGGFCLIVGMAKFCIDDRHHSKMAWTVSGLMKIVTPLVVYKTPDTNFHRLCCGGYIFGLVGAIIGALQNIYLTCSDAPESEREKSEEVMLCCSVLSFISMLIKCLGYLYSL